MTRKIFLTAAAALMALTVMSCMSTTYYGPVDHVTYRIADKPKSSTQVSSLTGDPKAALASTYDEEFTYDDKGNIVKVKQTEYFDQLSSQKKFIVWETESKVIGGNVVPWKISANGVTFCEVTYDLLTVAGSGAVREDISDRDFRRLTSSLLTRSQYDSMNIALDNISVSFRIDDRFVTEIRRYYTYGGSSTANVLTLGWDNIVLTGFHFSREKLAEGIGKSFPGYNAQSVMLQSVYKGDNVDYKYEWKVIADKICQTRMSYQTADLKLDVTQDYNTAGKRTKESWMLSNPATPDVAAAKVFEQTLTY